MNAPSTLRIPASDGLPLAADLFTPQRPLGCTVVINGAMGVARRFYHAFAADLAKHGFHVLCYDYRGIGDSTCASAEITDWGGKDFAAVLHWASTHTPSRRIAVVGHSVGGQIIGMAPQAHDIDAIVLVAAQSGYWKHWRGIKRGAMWLLWHAAIPLLCRLTGKMPMKMLGQGEDLPAGVALQWARWGRLPGYLFDPRSGVDLARYRSLRAPLRVYSFADDGYAPPAAVDALVAEYPMASISRTSMRPVALASQAAAIGHFGFFKPACSELWQDAASWLLKETETAHAAAG